jgi:heme-binding protein
MARVMSGVTFDTSNYLTLHPNVNDFFTSLKGQPRDQARDQVQTYLDANPQVRDELQAIRQPSVDFRQRCGVPQTP